MLFSSYEFIFLFLPVTLLVYFKIGGMGHGRMAMAWLSLMSLGFYAWWNPVYLALIVPSLLINFALGRELSARPRKSLLTAGVIANLGVLGYFKYANFFVSNVNSAFDSHWAMESVVLPLGISFITFQKVAYLVDAYRGQTRDYDFLRFCLFVLFFPQLIAGPIVHHKEIIPQFQRRETYRLRPILLSAGISIFVIGLLKKVLIADELSRYSTQAFDAVRDGTALTFFEAWRGALSYTFQLYFDFSGYSDMAIGLALMFGVRLPLNFNSPYKAVNIIDFWRRWHMTLSRFLRDYVYIPLGGSRRGNVRRYTNLMATMLIGGLWHGAGWTFVAWGGLHGIYLVINHAWHALKAHLFGSERKFGMAGRWTARVITFIAVVVAWVFFRAENFSAALSMLQGMAGMNGVVWPNSERAQWGSMASLLEGWGWQFHDSNLFRGTGDLGVIFLTLAFLWAMPNTQEIFAAYRPVVERVAKRARWPRWRPTHVWSVLIALGAVIAVLRLSHVSEFLYFRF